jgi:CRP-like cAMP-binding protein
VKTIGRGGFVLLEGDQTTSLNVLAAGRIKVIREPDEGRKVILRQIDPGEIFGGAGGWGGATYPASARARGHSVVLRLPAERFTALMREQPDFALAVVAELGRRLPEAEAPIRDLQSERVERRLARASLPGQQDGRQRCRGNRAGRATHPSGPGGDGRHHAAPRVGR